MLTAVGWLGFVGTDLPHSTQGLYVQVHGGASMRELGRTESIKWVGLG